MIRNQETQLFLFELYNPWLSEKFMGTLLRFLGYPQVFQECYRSKALELSFSTDLSPHRSFIYLFFQSDYSVWSKYCGIHYHALTHSLINFSPGIALWVKMCKDYSILIYNDSRSTFLSDILEVVFPKHRSLGNFNSRNLFYYNIGGWNSKVRRSAQISSEKNRLESIFLTTWSTI